MSLISQRDREVAIAALEKYAADVATTEYYLGEPHHSSMEVNALLNWIKLEYQKNENWTILEKVLYKSEKSDKIFKELREKTKRTPKYPVKHQVLLWNIVQK